MSEAAEVLGVHKKTVRNWINDGLPVVDEKRPLLISGTDLKIFVRQQRKRNRRKCRPSEIYCLRCREAREPTPGTAKFVQEEGGTGRVFARCCECDSKVNKYFSWRNLDALRREL
ncbi:helix-turn-helix domain-containing protein [Vibrio agarivorans]|uniref:helix-turn-helix domain-containing protein n=1 Tax=Vibrio agarivorans TaxID=153622 RepID=UPI00222F554E|nr:helix-turn-helix domain-containing protein [Vibrio agarivorans]